MDPLQCHSCQAALDADSFFCKKCEIIQYPKNVNYFQLFAIEQHFNIDKELLERKYLKLQSILHPDLFTQKTNLEQILAKKHSIILNKSYQILGDDLLRSIYILSLENIIINTESDDNVRTDHDVLLEILEIRERIEDLENKDLLKTIFTEVAQYIEDTYNSLADAHQKNNLRDAAQLSIKLKYYSQIQAKILRNLAR
jgi:molecular chaperone HscB